VRHRFRRRARSPGHPRRRLRQADPGARQPAHLVRAPDRHPRVAAGAADGREDRVRGRAHRPAARARRATGPLALPGGLPPPAARRRRARARHPERSGARELLRQHRRNGARSRRLRVELHDAAGAGGHVAPARRSPRQGALRALRRRLSGLEPSGVRHGRQDDRPDRRAARLAERPGVRPPEQDRLRRALERRAGVHRRVHPVPVPVQPGAARRVRGDAEERRLPGRRHLRLAVPPGRPAVARSGPALPRELPDRPGRRAPHAGAVHDRGAQDDRAAQAALPGGVLAARHGRVRHGDGRARGALRAPGHRAGEHGRARPRPGAAARSADHSRGAAQGGVPRAGGEGPGGEPRHRSERRWAARLGRPGVERAPFAHARHDAPVGARRAADEPHPRELRRHDPERPGLQRRRRSHRRPGRRLQRRRRRRRRRAGAEGGVLLVGRLLRRPGRAGRRRARSVVRRERPGLGRRRLRRHRPALEPDARPGARAGHRAADRRRAGERAPARFLGDPADAVRRVADERACAGWSTICSPRARSRSRA